MSGRAPRKGYLTRHEVRTFPVVWCFQAERTCSRLHIHPLINLKSSSGQKLDHRFQSWLSLLRKEVILRSAQHKHVILRRNSIQNINIPNNLCSAPSKEIPRGRQMLRYFAVSNCSLTYRRGDDDDKWLVEDLQLSFSHVACQGCTSAPT